MSERLLGKIRERISQSIVIGRGPKFGIDPEFILANDGSVETWKAYISNLKDEKKIITALSIAEALRRNIDERNEVIDDLVETGSFVFSIGTGASEQQKVNNEITQTIINVNSLSDRSLRNLAIAFGFKIQR
ncbi:MAG TPA: hypothetical protein VLE44_00125 [Candidatus Saccharimonadales bacterium]|nr:hypothetical protein [Candidatus Saccharimonadales bacterium]